jgi:hypothetical protein
MLFWLGKDRNLSNQCSLDNYTDTRIIHSCLFTERKKNMSLVRVCVYGAAVAITIGVGGGVYRHFFCRQNVAPELAEDIEISSEETIESYTDTREVPVQTEEYNVPQVRSVGTNTRRSLFRKLFQRFRDLEPGRGVQIAPPSENVIYHFVSDSDLTHADRGVSTHETRGTQVNFLPFPRLPHLAHLPSPPDWD